MPSQSTTSTSPTTTRTVKRYRAYVILVSKMPRFQVPMPNSYLAIKVQSIGVIDAILTASLLAGLICQSGVAVWKNVSTSEEFDTYVTSNRFQGPETPKTTYIPALPENQSQENGPETAINETDRWIFLDRPHNLNIRWWGFLFHDVVFGVGLFLVILAAMALVGSTNPKVQPAKAIKLVRIWLLGNILVVVMLSMSIVSVALVAKICGGLDIVMAWSIFYLSVRGICVWVCWIYLQELTAQLPTLIPQGQQQQQQAAEPRVQVAQP